jgi:hypothetical protein
LCSCAGEPLVDVADGHDARAWVIAIAQALQIGDATHAEEADSQRLVQHDGRMPASGADSAGRATALPTPRVDYTHSIGSRKCRLSLEAPVSDKGIEPAQATSGTRRALISAFIILTVVTLLVANQPPAFQAWKRETAERRLGPQPAWVLRYGEWLIRRYAHLVGLDNRWSMFSQLPRFDTWFVIKAKHRDWTREVLPLPLQSERSFAQRVFVDFKEAKLHLNIYNRPQARWAYGRHLCLTTAERTGTLPLAIIWERHYQNILERSEAAATGTHLDPEVHSEVIQVVECAAVQVGQER